MKSVYSIIATFNGLKWIDKCLGSLRASDYLIQTIVVDNRSSDGTREFVEKKYPEVDRIHLEKNLGFGQANNIGIKKALEEGADYIFLLNQDAWIESSTVGTLVKAMDSYPGYGLLSPMHLNGSGTGLDYFFSTYIEPDKCPGLLSDIYMGEVDTVYEARDVNAAAWFLRSNVIEKVGLFDDLFFVYGEDDNYRDRLRYHGYKIGIVPETRIYHDREDRGLQKKDVKTDYDAQLVRMKVTMLNPGQSISAKYGYLLQKTLSDIFRNLQNGNFSAIWANKKVFMKSFYYALRYRNRYKT